VPGTPWGFGEGFPRWFPLDALTGRALLLFLASPPRVLLDGGSGQKRFVQRSLHVQAGAPRPHAEFVRSVREDSNGAVPTQS
jgi:hypothetical protein